MLSSLTACRGSRSRGALSRGARGVGPHKPFRTSGEVPIGRLPVTARESNTHFTDSAANRLDDHQFVGINHLDLGLITHERRYANARQRRSEFHVVGSKLSGGAPFLKRVPGITQ